MRKAAYSLLMLLLVIACAEKRTKYTDKTMRVMIDPESITNAHYARLRQALVTSGKWFVVDRAEGFRAAKAEQERLHKTEADRYEPAEKYAMWGKMYGVGGIVVANAQCQINHTLFGSDYVHCLQTLSILDANTAEVITSISHEQDGDTDQLYVVPSWEEAVDKMNHEFPEKFDTTEYAQRLKDYRKEAAERSIASQPSPTPEK